MFRVTIMGRDLEEFQNNLSAYAAIHAGEKVTAVTLELPKGAGKTKTVEKIVEDYNEEMEEVESPYAQPTIAPAPKAAPVILDNELDAEGIPWDSRIHSSSKAKVKNGTWKIARGVSDEQAYPIKAELRARVQQANTNRSTPAPAPTAVVVPAQPVYQGPVVAPPTVAPVPQMNHQGHTLASFQSNFPLIISKLINDGKIDQEYINGVKTYFGVTEIWMLNDEQKAQLFDQYVEWNFIQKVG